jgi:hypothetical protein
MLVIRQEQMQAFEEPLLEIFIDKEALRVETSWPQRAAAYPDPQSLRGFVAECVKRARALKFRDRGQLRKLVDWECEFGPGFAEKPEWEWLKLIMTSDVDPGSRIFRTENRLKTLREKRAI